jgi:uncharacterized protein GlcG (DUF336 family)
MRPAGQLDPGPLNLDAARAIIAATFEQRRTSGFLPLAGAVLDAGGHLIAVEREDGASYLRPAIAIGKASGALGMGLGSRELARRAGQAPAFVQALTQMTGGGLVPVPGGVLIRAAADSPAVGAVGVSGDTSDHDEECAVHAIGSARFTADPG